MYCSCCLTFIECAEGTLSAIVYKLGSEGVTQWTTPLAMQQLTGRIVSNGTPPVWIAQGGRLFG